MAFTMENSPTANAAKLAVLWRDRDKRPPASGGGGYGVPDHWVEDVFEGGILPEVIPPPAGPPTTNPDGSTTPGMAPEPTLVNHKTVYTDAQAPQLASLYAAVQELRRIVASPAQISPTDPLYPLSVLSTEGAAASSHYFGDGIRSTVADLRALTHGSGAVFGGPDGMQDRVEALRAANKSILDVLLDLRAATFGVFGPEMTERIRDWIEANGVADRVPGINSGLLGAIENLLEAVDNLSRSLKFIDEQVLGTRVIPQLETAQKDLVSAEKRIKDLEERQSQLEARVGMPESGTSSQ